MFLNEIEIWCKRTFATCPLLLVTTSAWPSQATCRCSNECPRPPRCSWLPVIEQPRHQQNCPALRRWLFSSLVYCFFYFLEFRLFSCPSGACLLSKKVMTLIIYNPSFHWRLALLRRKVTEINRRRWLLSFSLSLFSTLSWLSAQRATLFGFRALRSFLDIVIFRITTRWFIFVSWLGTPRRRRW